MNIRAFFFRFLGLRKQKTIIPSQPRITVQVNISEFNNVWNQLAIELAGPKLNPLRKIDWVKVRTLEQKLATLRP